MKRVAYEDKRLASKGDPRLGAHLKVARCFPEPRIGMTRTVIAQRPAPIGVDRSRFGGPVTFYSVAREQERPGVVLCHMLASRLFFLSTRATLLAHCSIVSTVMRPAASLCTLEEWMSVPNL